MAHRKVALVLKVAVLLSVAACAVVGVFVIPQVEAANTVPAGSTIAYWIAIAPLIVLGAVAVKLFSAIGKGRIFAAENSRLLRYMAALSALDALLWLAVLILYLVARAEVPQLAVTGSLSVAIIFSVMLTAACATLSIFAERGTALQEENDLVV